MKPTNTNRYIPGPFSDVALTNLGRRLWKYLCKEQNVYRMEIASELRRPAIEAMACELQDEFGDDIHNSRIKQMIGHMVRQIMEAKGFQLDAPSIRIRRGGLFTFAARYKRTNNINLIGNNNE